MNRHIDPLREENERNFKIEMGKIDGQMRAHKFRSQTDCNHWQGWAPPSEHGSDKTSIVWHTLNKPTRGSTLHQETVGVCTGCNRIFRETDFDYSYWFNLPSGSFGSSADGGNPANRNFKSPTVVGPSQFAYPAEDLDKLSDAEIKFLFEGVQEYRKRQKKLNEYFSGPQWTVRPDDSKHEDSFRILAHPYK